MNTWYKALDLFTLAIALAFVVFGICIAVEVFDLEYLDAKFRIVFGIIFILYGLLRLTTSLVSTATKRKL